MYSAASMNEWFNSGATRSYAFRRKQLEMLREAILRNEAAIHEALYTDLRKNKEEAWVTETGFILSEISHTLQHLKKWMKPRRVATNLLNFPSRSTIISEPLGLVLIIAPWNYPFQLLLAPLVGAIAAGNAAVLKPAELAPATARVIRKLIEEVFHTDYIRVVEGEGAEVIPALIEANAFQHIFYTGSTAVGQKIYSMAAQKLVPVTLELGGKSPCVIEADADLVKAARRISVAKFSNAGQMCVAPDYILVHRMVKDRFIAEMKKVIVGFFGPDASSNYNFGRIINQSRFDRLLQLMQDGKIVAGGEHNREQLFIAPTLIDEVSIESAIMHEEIFGPLLPILSFNTAEEAKAIINRNPDPLAFYLFTTDSDKEAWWMREQPFGGGCINNVSWHLTNFNLPFGGRGNSGIGAYHGKFSFDRFSHQKAVMKTPTWFDPSVKYPPYEGKLSLFKKFIR